MSEASKASVTAKKRPRGTGDDPEGGPPKRLFSIFDKADEKSEGSSSSEPFKWLKLSFAKSCLYGTNLDPKWRPRIAAFDLDGTVIKSSIHKGKAVANADPLHWEFWNKLVPEKLKEVHESGLVLYSVVLVTNQNLTDKRLATWKEKIPLIAKKLDEVPFFLIAATSKDVYRKPMPGMWFLLEKLAQEENITIDVATSFFVGDAAGRQSDFAGTDRKWAENLHVPFHTPEEYFLGLPAQPYTLRGFHVSTLPKNVPIVTPTSSPIIPGKNDRTELVLFSGAPGTGKTTFYQRNFLPSRYEHINQDTLGSRPKCLKAAEEFLRKGVSCVVDNTNRDKKTRKYYIDLAQKLRVKVRCFVFQCSVELAWHNNLFRAFCEPLLDTGNSKDQKAAHRKLVPYSAIASFRNQFEAPTTDEGFEEVRHVNWIFEGDAKARRLWSMWLQIDGK